MRDPNTPIQSGPAPSTPNDPVSRRRFLSRTITGLGAAVLAPSIVPASALGRDNSVAPSERINMAFIGLGGQGAGHLFGQAWTYVPGGYVARNDVQVLAVCDVKSDRREGAWRRANEIYAVKTGQAAYDGVRAYNDFREALARPDIDAVLLALPYHWAAMMSIHAMRAGKDVYCEKPIAMTVRDGLSVAETARRHARIYQAGTQQRSEYGAKFRVTAELVRNGRIGKLQEVYAYRQPGCFFPQPWTSNATQPVPEGFDWDLWLGPIPWRPFAGESGHALSGMFIGDVNWTPHHYDIIQWTINPDHTAPIEVWREDTDGKTENAVIHYKYSNGVVVHSKPYPGERIGDEGGACFVGTEGRINVERSNLISSPTRILEEPLRPDDSRVYRVTGHSANFLECVRSRRQPICNPSEAVYTMNAILIGGIALALNRRLVWNPVKAEFVNDAEANRLLSFTPRAPWRL